MSTRLLSPLGVVGLYLAAVLPLLVAGVAREGGVASAGVLALHLAALAGTGWWLARRDPRSTAASLLALAAIPLLYAQVPWLNQALAPGFHDPLVASWERALLGFDPSRELAALFPFRWISEPLHLAYASFYPVLYLPPLLLALRGRSRELATTTVGIMVAAAACYLAFSLFPVEGPRYFGPPPGIPGGPVREMVLLILERGSSRGAAFPSAHMALMTAQAVLTLRFQRRAGAVVAALAVGVALGAVYGGFHYAVDVLAGAAVGAGSAWLALRVREVPPTSGSAAGEAP